MNSSPLPSTSESGRSKPKVKVVLATEGSRPVFKLTWGTDTITLTDSSAMNRWAAVGIVERHNLVFGDDGVTVDGQHLPYADAHAAEQLESILNLHRVTPSPSSSPVPHPRPKVDGPEETSQNFSEGVRVTRDGFEFHVVYRTRFGETKTEKLDAALESFQKMRLLKPHISLQKSGIRLVVTRWDGENFIEEPGIENLEHASPEGVEALIRSHLLGGAATQTGFIPTPAERSVPVRVDVVKGAHDNRFHLVIHRQDGTEAAGALLIRANMAKLAAEKLFLPDVTISMTAMNDRIIIEQPVPGQAEKRSETLPLATAADARRLAEVLNSCLRTVSVKPVVTAPPEALPAPPAPPVVDVTKTERVAPPPPPQPQTPVGPSEPEPLLEQVPVPDLRAVVKEPAAVSPTVELFGQWVKELFGSVSVKSGQEVNEAVFEALRQKHPNDAVSNDHGFPAIALAFAGKDGGTVPWEIVLAPHYLLCQAPFGYMRFGPETRLFLARLDDYVGQPGNALRGVVETSSGAGLKFIISDEFDRFLRGNTERNYRTPFSDMLLPVAELSAGDSLIWPVSREERLFEMLASVAGTYALPVTPDSIVLDTRSPEFIGFKRCAPNGMEFRDGEDYVRFTPLGLVCSENGIRHEFAGVGLLTGWALDAGGRVCAIYRETSGLVPDSNLSLLRFISDQNLGAESASLNVMAKLSA